MKITIANTRHKQNIRDKKSVGGGWEGGRVGLTETISFLMYLIVHKRISIFEGLINNDLICRKARLFFVEYHLHHLPGLPYDLHRGGTKLKSAWYLQHLAYKYK